MGGNATEFRACAECTRFCRSRHSHKRDDLSPLVSSFVKILIGNDWDKMLLLPPVFALTVADQVGKETELENAVGERWTVTLSSYHDRIGFLKGWENFVMDHKLNGGDFLVFNYIKGSNFTVHIYGKTLCEKNCNGSFRRNQPKGNASAQLKPCERKYLDVKGRLIQSRMAAPGLKSGPSVPRTVFKSSAAPRAQHFSNCSYRMPYFEVHERQLASGNNKSIDGGILASNLVHTDPSSQAKVDQYQVGTENLMSSRISKVADVNMTGKDHTYMGSVADGKAYCIGTENVMSKTFTKVTQVSMTEKDKPLVLRDDSTHIREIKTSASLPNSLHFKPSGEEPIRKDEGAVFPNRGHICTDDLKEIVIKELYERSEPGHYNAKRKRGSFFGCPYQYLNSTPHGITNFKQLKIEPCDVHSSDQGIVTCSAVTSGERLELPDKLPALRYLKRGGKAIFLQDQKSRMWPALYEEKSGLQVLICDWDKFSSDNDVKDGDNYVLTVEDAVQFIYKISVIRPM